LDALTSTLYATESSRAYWVAMSHIKYDGVLGPAAKITELQASIDPDTLLNAMRSLEHSPVAIALASLSGELLSINVKAEQIFGIAHGIAPSGHYVADAFSEASHFATLEAVARDGRERHFEMFSAQGSGRHFFCKLARIEAGNGIPAWLALGMFEYDHRSSDNVSTIDAAETARIIHPLVGLATWKIRTGDDNNLLDSTMLWSQELFRLLNAKPSLRRQTLRDYLEFVVADDRDAVLLALSRSLSDGSIVSVVYRLQPQNGAAKLVASRAMPVRDPASELTREIWGVEQDVTSMFDGHPPSQEKASILDAVASSMEGPIFAVDRELRFTYFNDFVRKEMGEVFGTDPEIGKKAIGASHRRARRRVMLRNLRHALGGTRIVDEILIPCDKLIARHYELTYSPIVNATITTGVAVFGVRLKRDPGFLMPSLGANGRPTIIHA